MAAFALSYVQYVFSSKIYFVYPELARTSAQSEIIGDLMINTTISILNLAVLDVELETCTILPVDERFPDV